MKNTIKRFVFGIFSTALLAVGLVRAADQFDPMTLSVSAPDALVKGTAPDTSNECDILDVS
jgi:hypothetical protein